MANITASVGKGGVNKRVDVLTVQKLLNQHIRSITPLRPLAENGRVGPATLGAIEEFQRRVVGLTTPDGRVDPNGRTLRALNQHPVAPASITGTGSPRVTYSTSLPPSKQIVSAYALSVIKLALRQTGMPQAVITSTIRTPDEQARIMYGNAKKNLKGQFKLYGATGDEVLKVYEANRTRPESEVIKLMEQKIEDLLKQGRRTSNHVVTTDQYKTLNIFDIGVNSTRAVCGAAFDIDKFTKVLNGLVQEGYIDRLIDETNKSNSCWHIEIQPNKKPLPD